MNRMSRRVEKKDTVTIRGVVYTFGRTSADAYNNWLNRIKRSVEMGLGPVSPVTIHLHAEDGESGGSFSSEVIQKNLEA